MKTTCFCGKPIERLFSNIFQDLSLLGFLFCFVFYKILRKKMLHRGPVTAISSQTLHHILGGDISI